MSTPTVLSVDGAPGIDFAHDREAHLALAGKGSEIALLGYGETGRHGANAPAALPGRPAGLLAVKLSQSRSRPGGVTVTVIRQESMGRVPEVTEILQRGQVLLSAKGGNGEPGRHGGNGQTGLPGKPGEKATEDVDATVGERGGNGGNAGHGSRGGDGGAGGMIEIHVDENDTHLLLIASWNVSGGMGGEAGRHGEPGAGGAGGAGGEAHVWEEQVGYKYRCTDDCVGKTTTALAVQCTRDPTINMMRNIGAQMNQGSALTTTVARVAQVYHNVSNNAVDGACRCHGGPEHCAGCAATPIWRNYSRPKGIDGRKGAAGEGVSDALLDGAEGIEGRAVIVVVHRAGDLTRYDRRFSLQLEDFDLEDENGDGIFEPGEHIVVRRVRVKNTGGMPSPSCGIPCSFVASNTLESVDGNGGRVVISRSIPAGHVAASQDSAKVLIRTPNIDPRSRQSYVAQQSISIQATVPWLDCQLENFDLEKILTIQYPLELKEMSHLETVAHGTTTEISWKVFNRSNIDFGSQDRPARQAKIRISMFAEDGSLRCAQKRTWQQSLDIVVPPVKAKSSVTMKQTIRLALNVRPYKRVKVALALHITPARLGRLSTTYEISSMQFIQGCDAEMQVSPGHVYNKDAHVLVVTNADTSRAQFEALKDFLETRLSLKMDIWNLSLHGRLFTADSGQADKSENVLLLYRGKLIIFLGNRFDFFGDNEISCLGLCDATSLSEACTQHTSCLFLRPADEPINFEKLVLTVSDRITDGFDKLSSPSQFSNILHLVYAVQQETVFSRTLYSLEIPKRWYLSRQLNVSRSAKTAVKVLRNHLPQERFWVCQLESVGVAGNDIDGYLLIYRGLPHQTSIFTAQSGLFRNRRGESSLRLPGAAGVQSSVSRDHKTLEMEPYDQYSIISALTLTQRIDLIWSTGGFQSEKTIPDKLMDLLILSIQEDLISEISGFLHGASWPNCIEIDQSALRCLSIHLPRVQLVLEHPKMTDLGPIPPEITRLLYYILAACQPQKKRNKVAQILLPFGHRQSQLRFALTGRIEGILLHKDLNSDQLHEFHANVASLRSNGIRRTDMVLAEQLSQATGKSTHFLDKAKVDLNSIYPRTRIWTEREWDARYEAAQEHDKEVTVLMQRAWDEKYRLIMEEGDV